MAAHMSSEKGVRNRFARSSDRFRTRPRRAKRFLTPFSGRGGFTLVEILVAMAVTLLMLGMVVTIFALITDNVSASRATMEMTDQLRAAKQRLQLDLAGVTTQMLPPRRPEFDEGYFEIIEGPVGRLAPYTQPVLDDFGNRRPDSTVGDNDDILMFTTRSASQPFVGRYQGAAAQSPVAEVAWFIRGTTLYRRQLLVRPTLTYTGVPARFYANDDASLGQYSNDISVHLTGTGYDLGPKPATTRVVANSLGDLTKRENRFAHVPLQSTIASPYGWPHDVRGYGTLYYKPSGTVYQLFGRLGLPTLRDCSTANWVNPGAVIPQVTLTQGGLGDTNTSPLTTEPFDAWESGPGYGPNPWDQVDPATGGLTAYAPDNRTRLGEDIILTNVLSFDVRVWDPTARIMADERDASNKIMMMPGDPTYASEPVGSRLSTLEYFAKNKGAGESTTDNKVYTVGRGAYVDLNHAATINASVNLSPAQKQAIATSFSGPGDGRSGLQGGPFVAAVYDTGSSQYEHDGIDQGNSSSNGIPANTIDEGTNGIDDNSNGVIDEEAELEAPPPYRVPLRGVQIKIRCFEPASAQIREVTVVQEFLPE